MLQAPLSSTVLCTKPFILHMFQVPNDQLYVDAMEAAELLRSNYNPETQTASFSPEFGKGTFQTVQTTFTGIWNDRDDSRPVDS